MRDKHYAAIFCLGLLVGRSIRQGYKHKEEITAYGLSMMKGAFPVNLIRFFIKANQKPKMI